LLSAWWEEPYIARVAQPLLFAVGVKSDAVVSAVSVGIAYTIITFLHVVLGELTPKTLAIRKSLSTAFVGRPRAALFHVIAKACNLGAERHCELAAARLVPHRGPSSEGELCASEEELRHIFAESQKSKKVTETGERHSAQCPGLERPVPARRQPDPSQSCGVVGFG